MATRDTLDNLLDVAKDALKDGQDTGRTGALWGAGYGQTLQGGGTPSDQANPGPTLPASLKDDARIDVYESPAGFGWTLLAIADEGGTIYHKKLTSHEGGVFVESNWEEQDVELPSELPPGVPS
jgi:hypothetical protein